jgi:hypothetical protein
MRAWVRVTWQGRVFFSDSAGNSTDGAKFTASGDLAALKESRIVTRQVESIDASPAGRACITGRFAGAVGRLFAIIDS